MTRDELIVLVRRAWRDGVSTDHALDLADVLEREGHNDLARWLRQHTWSGGHSSHAGECSVLWDVGQELERGRSRES